MLEETDTLILMWMVNICISLPELNKGFDFEA